VKHEMPGITSRCPARKALLHTTQQLEGLQESIGMLRRGHGDIGRYSRRERCSGGQSQNIKYPYENMSHQPARQTPSLRKLIAHEQMPFDPHICQPQCDGWFLPIRLNSGARACDIIFARDSTTRRLTTSRFRATRNRTASMNSNRTPIHEMLNALEHSEVHMESP
jgi:hypothetical protein